MSACGLVISCAIRVISRTDCTSCVGVPSLRMTSDGMRTSRVVALALVVGAFFTAQEVFMDLARRRPELAEQDVVNGFVFWVVWAFLTPAALIAVRRWPLEAKPFGRPLLAHASVAGVLAVLHNVITLGADSLGPYLSGSSGGFTEALRRNASPTAFVWGFFVGVLFYAVIVMVYAALRFRDLYVVEQRNAAALQAELTQTKLDTLRSQLRPHFLFNTLNAISVLVTEDAGTAQQMILRLSTLLRRSLDEEAHEVSLRQELAFVNDYLDIQRGRFGDQLAVDVAVDHAAMDASVPVFLLQPLLENAIEHGKREDTRTTIVLRAGRDRDMLCLTLEDDGRGLGDGDAVRAGIGLGNTRARLHHLYGTHATAELHAARDNGDSGGARVEIRIPFRAASA
jgi:two-component system LytT family sensor kinase